MALFTLRMDGVDWRPAKLSNGTKEVFVVHLFYAIEVMCDKIRDLM